MSMIIQGIASSVRACIAMLHVFVCVTIASYGVCVQLCVGDCVSMVFVCIYISHMGVVHHTQSV